jgi:hypothetical protein
MIRERAALRADAIFVARRLDTSRESFGLAATQSGGSR